MRIFRHGGASHIPGKDLVYVHWHERDGGPETAWNTQLAPRRLATPLQVAAAQDGEEGRYGVACCYPLLPLELIERALQQAAAPGLDGRLAQYAYDAEAYNGAYGLYREEALRRGWPAWPVQLGFTPSLLVGAGIHHRLLPMNLGTALHPIAVLSGNKACNRDLLRAYGLPVAAGGCAQSPDEALALARELGWPVVLKRLSGANSDGVIAGVAAARACREAAAELLKGQQAIMVERHLGGTELRVHFINGRVEELCRREPVLHTADGRCTLEALLGREQPRTLELTRHSPLLAQQLVYRLWNLGVRRLADLGRIVPPEGMQIQLGKRFGERRSRVRSGGWLAPADRGRLEAMFASLGSPSGGVDLIVPQEGAPLDQGGGVLELNVPSGFWYLSDKRRCVGRELDAWVGGDPAFRRWQGRVPLWLIPVGASAGAVRALRRQFRARYPQGIAATLVAGWLPLLTTRATALLLEVEEDDIARHGLPFNMDCTVWLARPGQAAAVNAPLLFAALENSGSALRLRRLPRP